MALDHELLWRLRLAVGQALRAPLASGVPELDALHTRRSNPDDAASWNLSNPPFERVRALSLELLRGRALPLGAGWWVAPAPGTDLWVFVLLCRGWARSVGEVKGLFESALAAAQIERWIIPPPVEPEEVVRLLAAATPFTWRPRRGWHIADFGVGRFEVACHVEPPDTIRWTVHLLTENEELVGRSRSEDIDPRSALIAAAEAASQTAQRVAAAAMAARELLRLRERGRAD